MVLAISRRAAVIPVIAVLGVAVLASGCQGPTKATGLPEGQQALETSDTVVYMDKFGSTLLVAGQKMEWTSDRRLKVFANLQNNSDHDLHVLVSTQFKDSDGFGTGDETPWANVIIPRNSMYAYQAVAMNDKASKYAIRVRAG